MGKIKGDIKHKGIITSSVILVIILDLLLLYYFKYKNLHLPVSNFNLSNKGNLINLVFTSVLVIEVFAYSVFKRIKFQSILLTGYCSLMTFLLICSFLFIIIKIPLPYYYILDHTLRDFIKGILFSGFQFVQFLFISTLWLILWGNKKFLLLKTVIISIVISILLLFYAFINIYASKASDLQSIKKGGKNYVGVVLGAAVWPKNEPSPSLASRTEKAYNLYNEGVIKKIQLTGGHAPGELSESEVAYKYLIDKGVKPSDIWIEKKTANTIEQISFIRTNLVLNKNIRDIIIISDEYHLKRISEICNFFNIKIKEVASDLYFGEENKIYYKTKESIGLLFFWFFAL